MKGGGEGERCGLYFILPSSHSAWHSKWHDAGWCSGTNERLREGSGHPQGEGDEWEERGVAERANDGEGGEEEEEWEERGVAERANDGEGGEEEEEGEGLATREEEE
ncbi:hypothetical protein BHE74_00013379 [Ensete ventricosum]|nr:hypothetical protein BHE74_00013379 [Ensete ventricosum]